MEKNNTASITANKTELMVMRVRLVLRQRLRQANVRIILIFSDNKQGLLNNSADQFVISLLYVLFGIAPKRTKKV